MFVFIVNANRTAPKKGKTLQRKSTSDDEDDLIADTDEETDDYIKGLYKRHSTASQAQKPAGICSCQFSSFSN